jgi:hypothetical protein
LVPEFLAAPPRGRLQRLALEQRLAQLLAARREQAQTQACRQPVLLHPPQQLRPVRKPHQRSAARLRQHRVQLRVGGSPRNLPAIAAAKRGLHRAEGREAQPTPDRALKPNDLSRDPANLKATLAHASRIPAPGNLTLINPAQAKRPLEHIIARKQANAKAVVRPRNLKDNNKQFEF